MERAVGLAEKGEGWCHPNPKVGAVIVKDGRVIGEGYHAKYGELHAERNALASLTESAEGADLYVTLEPCCHYGKQPPCTEAIKSSGIRRVIIGSRDPNPKVRGGGVRALREAGVEVVEDFMREECDRLNPVFFHYITTGTPYVCVKYAMTMDGKIATKIGASRWITGEEAREAVQHMRNEFMGIMVGIGTVFADDPLLNCRIPGGRSPARIIADSSMRLPPDSRIAQTAGSFETFDVCSLMNLPAGEITRDGCGEHLHGTERERADRLLDAGIRILNFPDHSGSAVDLRMLTDFLGERGIDGILLEGGGTLNESALRAGIVREVRVFIAPKIFGGRAKSPVEGRGVELPSKALHFEYAGARAYGGDVLLRYRAAPPERQEVQR